MQYDFLVRFIQDVYLERWREEIYGRVIFEFQTDGEILMNNESLACIIINDPRLIAPYLCVIRYFKNLLHVIF